MGHQSSTPLHRAVEASTGERAVRRALEKLPWVMMELVVSGSNLCHVISRFKFGNEYEVDFVVLHGFSGAWDIHFIELEPPSVLLFNTKGDFSPRLNHAAGQIRRWKNSAARRDKAPYLATQLRDAVIEKDLLYHEGKEQTDSAGWKITDPNSGLFMHYHVIMGRRHHLPDELMARKAALVETDGFELITYDRVLEVHERQRRDPTYAAA